MYAISNRTKLCALLLGVIFLAAQFHFCADLTPAPSGSHFCQLCSAAGSAVATASPSIALVPVANPLEVFAEVPAASAEVSRAVAPRAPPAL